MGQLTQCIHEGFRSSAADEAGRSLQCVQPWIGRRTVEQTHLFDVHTVDLIDFVDEQFNEFGRGQLNHDVVNRSPAAPLEDVDPHNVALHRTDSACDLPEGAGPVWDPNSQHIAHWRSFAAVVAQHGHDATGRS